MTDAQPDREYPVLVSVRDGTYELRIQELLLVVRGTDLEQAYQELMKRKQEVFDWAESFEALDEVPPAQWPTFGAPVARSARMASAIRDYSRKLWKRLF